VELRAQVLEIKDRKTTLHCDFYSDEIKTASADVITIRVFDSSKNKKGNVFK